MGGYSDMMIDLMNAGGVLATTENETLVELEAKTIHDLSYEQLIAQYLKIYNYCTSVFAKRTALAELKPYFLVFKPLDKHYDRDTFNAKGFESLTQWCRKQSGSHTYLITKEKNAAKIHFNVIIFTTEHDYVERYHGKVFANKYKIYCEAVECLDRCIQYILKEAKERLFERYLDWDVITRKTMRSKECITVKKMVNKSIKLKRLIGPSLPGEEHSKYVTRTW